MIVLLSKCVREVFVKFHICPVSKTILVPNIYPRNCLLRKKSHSPYSFAMGKAYCWHLNDSPDFHLSFHYIDSETNLSRQFNFNRQITEDINSLCNRIAVNVGKALSKKIKKKKKSQEELRESRSDEGVTVHILKNGEKLSDAVSCKNLFSVSDSELQLNINGVSFNLVLNAPWISALSLPNSILAGFPLYPSKFDHIFLDKNQTAYTWYRSSDSKDWTPVGSGFIYTPSNDDIEYFLKLKVTPRNELLEGPEIEAVSKGKVEAGPGLCPFEARHLFTAKKLAGQEFRAVSYNILADLYCDSEHTRNNLFPYCPPYALTLDYRKNLIIKEILGYNADLICLQEVDGKVHTNDLEPILSTAGFGSVFNKKGHVSEGLAIFYNETRFKCIESNVIVLGTELNENPIFENFKAEISKNQKLLERISPRTTSLQTATLQSLDFEDRLMLVANTHLYFHPNADHIRLLQGALCIRYIEHALTNLKKLHPTKRVSVIFCGDFNSVPECGIYQLYTTGSVGPDHVDWRSFVEEAINGIELKQDVPLASACGTPDYTNFTAGFRACLDYIFYERSQFDVAQVVPFPSEEELSLNMGLPSVVFPSDHIALVADLKWK